MELRRLQEMDHHLIHPFTNHKELHAEGTRIIDSAKGVYVIDGNKRPLLDGIAGLWCVNVGYGRTEIIDAVTKQMKQLAYYPSFFNSTTEATILLADKLTKLAPKTMTRVFFSNSGSESNETTLKMVRAYHVLKKQPEKMKVLTLSYGYHGVTMATTSMTQLPSCQKPFNLPLSGFLQVPGPYRFETDSTLDADAYEKWCLEETEKIIQQEGAKTIGALFAEPVQGAGGVVVPTRAYLTGLRKLCRQYDILFVADEVITGFGRLGAWFASDLWDLDPDLISVAKGLSSGYLPIGASLVRDEIGQVLHEGGYFAHGYTYGGHPSACAAALANLEIIEKENLIAHVHEDVGPYFQSKIASFKNHPAVGETRGFGLIGAIELLPRHGGKAARDPNAPLGPKASNIAREEGVIVRGLRDLIAMAPPLVINKSEIDILFDAVAKVLDRLWE